MALRTLALLPTTSGHLSGVSSARLYLQWQGGDGMIRYLCDPPPTVGGWILILGSIGLVLVGVLYNVGMRWAVQPCN